MVCWDLAFSDLRYAGPLFVILIGAVILIVALAQNMRRHSEGGTPATRRNKVELRGFEPLTP